MAAPADLEARVARWAAHDEARAVLPADRGSIAGARALRAALLEAVLGGRRGRDLFQASADLGRHLAEHGASPTLAACTLDGARAAAGDVEAPWDAMRGALAEGFAAGERDRAARAAAAAWEYPRCAVRLDATRVALVAGVPEDDGEAIAAWAARVARAVVKAGYRQAVLDGQPRAREALVEALETAGLTVLDQIPEDASARGRLRLWPLAWSRKDPARGRHGKA